MSLEISQTTDLTACLAIRRVVFTLEQNVPEAEEVDGLDPQAIHLLALRDGRAVGTARILVLGDTGKIGRVAVLADQRGTGLGAAIVLACIEALRGLPDVKRAKLGAQTYAIGFYERLGFTAYGPLYLDAGIKHRDMERAL